MEIIAILEGHSWQIVMPEMNECMKINILAFALLYLPVMARLSIGGITSLAMNISLFDTTSVRIYDL